MAVYAHELSEDPQVDFKSKAKGFVRTYGFLSCVLPYTNAAWEKRSIFLNFLLSKLPAPREEDLSKGILDAIDMDSYRVEKRVVQKILLPDEDAEIDPVPTSSSPAPSAPTPDCPTEDATRARQPTGPEGRSTDGGSNCSEAGRPVNTRTAAGLPQEAGATPGRRSSPCSPSSNSV